MERFEILKMINSNPDLINSVGACLYHHKTFAIVRFGSSIDTFIKTRKGAEGYINRQCLNSYYDESTGDMTSVGSGKTIMQINEYEVCDINDKAVWYRYIENLFRKNWLQTNDIIWEVKKYCRSNQDTINFVTELMKGIKDNNYLSMPIYKEYEYKEEPEQVEEVKETESAPEVENNNDDITVSFNEEKNGIEIKFNCKPDEEVRTELKNNGFKWSRFNKIWWAKDNEQRREFLINKGYLVIKEESNEQNEEVKTITTESTSEPIQTVKRIEQIPEVAKESNILNDIQSINLTPANYVYVFAAKDIKNKRSLINRCCITTLKVVNDEQFNYIIDNVDKNLFEIEEGNNTLNENESEYINSILIYNEDKNKIKIILNNKVLQFFENRKGSIVKLVKPYKLDNKTEVNNCITPQITTTKTEKIKNNLVVEPEKIIIEEEKKEIKQIETEQKQNIKEIIKEITEPAQKNYESLINENIKKYSISEELNRRVNSVSFIVSDRDYNKDLKEFLNGCKDEVLKVINMTNDTIMKDKILSYLEYFNKKYFENYTRILNHKANNPSWVVTGRGGLNKRKYDKALSRYDNLLLDNSNLVDSFNNKMSKFRNDIKRTKRQEINNKIDSFTKTNINKIKFEKVKVKICCSNVTDIFNNGTYEVTAYKYDNYYIIKNWGCWRIYNEKGNEIATTRTNTTLKAAKDYLTYLLSNAA